MYHLTESDAQGTSSPTYSEKCKDLGFLAEEKPIGESQQLTGGWVVG
jgi:hypothetical protein